MSNQINTQIDSNNNNNDIVENNDQTDQNISNSDNTNNSNADLMDESTSIGTLEFNKVNSN